MQKYLGPNSLILARFIWARIVTQFILDYKSPTLNYLCLFNYLMSMIFSNLFIAFDHIPVGKNLFGPTWQFRFYLFI